MLACAALAGAVFGSPAALAADIVIHAGRLIDGVSKAPREQVSILIHDDRITAVQPGFVSPAGAQALQVAPRYPEESPRRL